MYAHIKINVQNKDVFLNWQNKNYFCTNFFLICL